MFEGEGRKQLFAKFQSAKLDAQSPFLIHNVSVPGQHRKYEISTLSGGSGTPSELRIQAYSRLDDLLAVLKRAALDDAERARATATVNTFNVQQRPAPPQTAQAAHQGKRETIKIETVKARWVAAEEQRIQESAARRARQLAKEELRQKAKVVGRLATGQARSGKQPQPGADNQARPQTNWAPPPALTPPPSIATGALSAYELAERRKSGFAKEELAQQERLHRLEMHRRRRKGR